jgi:FAD-dependent urate hydroxylase
MLGTRGRSVLTLPVGRGDGYCFAAVNSAAIARRRLAASLRRLRTVGTDLARQAPDAHFAPLYETRGDDWVKDRVADRARGARLLTSMAQRGAMALEDALVLAGMLAAVRTRTNVLEILSRYRDRRATRVGLGPAQVPSPGPGTEPARFARRHLFQRSGLRLIRANHAGLLSPP